MKAISYFFLLLFTLFSVMNAAPIDNKPYFILKNREGAGMFSMFTDVLSLLDSYERNIFNGVEVDFKNEGVYFDSKHGPNWWNYYCEPIALGSRKNVIEGYHGHYPGFSPLFFYKTRLEAYSLIQKYIHFKPHILDKIEAFKKTFFKEYYMIGVHYRGTDAPESSPPYEIYFQEISKIVSDIGSREYRIFIATDEQPFLEFMDTAFPGKICYQTNALRSEKGGAPLHKIESYNHYLQGEETVLDCALLSNCSLMILTYSNLSQWACLFNPYADVIDLSKKLPVTN